ncbi:tetratricopeptide repeat protein [Candidatus Halobeggiatoa sp. HSG11]|nr:tetratricopeptide repeat protein [Candidatus Halobeggiatoa sp. HSG11]
MAVYETEEEQVEALKKWWKENGLSVVGGVAIGFALLFGWRWWQAYTEQQSHLASDAYEHILISLEQKQTQRAHNTADKLLAEHSNSAYSIFAALNLARQDVEDGEIETAHARLQWIIDQQSGISELTHIARLRKAKLLISQDKLDDASNLIANIKTEKFKGSYTELRGDIAIKQGKMDVARTAYTEAVKSESLSAQHLDWIQMKLDDLGPVERINAAVPDVLATPTTAELSTELPVELGTPQTTQK